MSNQFLPKTSKKTISGGWHSVPSCQPTPLTVLSRARNRGKPWPSSSSSHSGYQKKKTCQLLPRSGWILVPTSKSSVLSGRVFAFRMAGVGLKIVQSRCRYRIPDGYFVDVSAVKKATFAHHLSDPSLANIRMVSGWNPDGAGLHDGQQPIRGSSRRLLGIARATSRRTSQNL